MMHPAHPLKPLSIHAPMWDELRPSLQSKTMPNAFFWTGPQHASLLALARAFMAAVMCNDQDAPCGSCIFCTSLAAGTCPDVHEVRLEPASTVIKIDQIRALHPTIDQAPQRGSHRFVLIEPADKLNAAAANALLKVLEEPPARTFFILISEQVTGLPLTLLSRCQRHIFVDQSHVLADGRRDYLGLGRLHQPSSTRALLCDVNGSAMDALLSMFNRQITACTVAASLATNPLDEVLWFLYLLMSQAIHDHMLYAGSSTAHQVIHKIRELHPDKLFMQLSNIVSWMKMAQGETRLNPTLVLEVFLLDFFVGGGEQC